MPVTVREISGDAERELAYALRREVFTDEQGVPAELDVDEHDAAAVQLIAVDDDTDEIVATCRLVRRDADTMLLGRMVVRRTARRRGIASLLLADAQRRARAQGCARLALSAQTYATPLYAAAGYVAYGETYDDAGIEHIAMELVLA